MNELHDIILESEYNVLNSLYEYYNKQFMMESFIMEDDKPEVHVNNNQQNNTNQSLGQRFIAWCQKAIEWIKSKVQSIFKSNDTTPIKPDTSALSNLSTDFKFDKDAIVAKIEELKKLNGTDTDPKVLAKQISELTDLINKELETANSENDQQTIKLCTDYLKELTKISQSITPQNNTEQNNTQTNTQNNSDALTKEQQEAINNIKGYNWHPPKSPENGDIWGYIDKLSFDDAVKYVRPMLKDIDKRIKYLDGYNSSDTKVQSVINRTLAMLKQNGDQLVFSVNERHTDADQSELLPNPYKDQPGDNKMNPNNDAHTKHDMLTPYKQKQQNQGG